MGGRQDRAGAAQGGAGRAGVHHLCGRRAQQAPREALRGAQEAWGADGVPLGRRGGVSGGFAVHQAARGGGEAGAPGVQHVRRAHLRGGEGAELADAAEWADRVWEATKASSL